MTAMLGGCKEQALLDRFAATTPAPTTITDYIKSVATKSVAEHLGVAESPKLIVKTWTNALPQYTIGHAGLFLLSLACVTSLDLSQPIGC